MHTQIEALKRVPAFRNVHIFRPGYAIEYDFFDPTQLEATLETKLVKNLFFAGQINGTTGYEEAAGQGMMAAINAHIKCHGGKPFTLRRDEAYIGVLIDDLITKGVDEPYRMFTSRAEYRILLRQDNADERLTHKAAELGLATQERVDLLDEKTNEVNRIIEFSKKYSLKPDKINSFLESVGTSPLKQGVKLIELLSRPQISIETVMEAIPALKEQVEMITNRKEEIIESANIKVKYEGYIKRERLIADKITRLEDIDIKDKFNYKEILSISTEAREKLTTINPQTIAQASRIPGVSPNDISVLLVLLGR